MPLTLEQLLEEVKKLKIGGDSRDFTVDTAGDPMIENTIRNRLFPLGMQCTINRINTQGSVVNLRIRRIA